MSWLSTTTGMFFLCACAERTPPAPHHGDRIARYDDSAPVQSAAATEDLSGSPTDAASPETDDLSFLRDQAPPAPREVGVPCDEITREDGSCCSVVRVDNACSEEDINHAAAKEEEATREWKNSISTESKHGPKPGNPAQLTRAWFTATLKDPYSAKYGRVTKPRKEYKIVDAQSHAAAVGWSVCANVNAKNGFGAYTGATQYWFLIVNNKIVDAREFGSGDQIDAGRLVDCSDGP